MEAENGVVVLGEEIWHRDSEPMNRDSEAMK
jgi:hypothetical protein